MPRTHAVEWINGQPHSKIYGDVFFSRESGLEETRYVFLQGNALARRWSALRTGEVFVIGETGFGAGLNFLTAWHLWNQLAPSGRLHFFSYEQHPLTRNTLQRIHALWPEISSLSAQFLALHEELSWGWHRFAFQNGEIMLTLVLGDARQCMKRMIGQAQAWFLDGFSPARNPQLWGDEVFEQIARLSRPQATFATYTSAGSVRRGLQNAGFSVERKQGFGRKREMMTGYLHRTKDGGSPDLAGNHAIVVGGGIAGCSASWSIARRGWKVTLLQGGESLAAHASGNPQATLHIRLPKHMLPPHQIALLGYQYSARLCNQLLRDSPSSWQQCGAIQLGHASRGILDADTLSMLDLPSTVALNVSRDEAAYLSGVPVQSGGLHFPRGGWLHGPDLCQRLASHPLVETRLNNPVKDIFWSSVEKRWIVETADGEVSHAPVVVIANAHDALTLPNTSHLPLHRVGGQITLVPATTKSTDLRSILCGEGLITPSRHGFHTVGATYSHERQNHTPSSEEENTNLKMLRTLSPEMYEAVGLQRQSWPAIRARVAFRSTSPDRTPIAGKLTGRGWEGLFVSLAHGSRGFATAPLIGEVIASQIAAEPAPLPTELIAILNPNRFSPPGLAHPGGKVGFEPDS